MQDDDATPAFLRRMDTVLDLLARICVLLAGISIVIMTGSNGPKACGLCR